MSHVADEYLDAKRVFDEKLAAVEKTQENAKTLVRAIDALLGQEPTESPEPQWADLEAGASTRRHRHARE